MPKKRRLVEFIDDVGAEPKFIEVDDTQDAKDDKEEKDQEQESKSPRA